MHGARKRARKRDGARTRALGNILRDAHRQTAQLLQRLERGGGDAQAKVHPREAERGASWMELLDFRERRGGWGRE